MMLILKELPSLALPNAVTGWLTNGPIKGNLGLQFWVIYWLVRCTEASDALLNSCSLVVSWTFILHHGKHVFLYELQLYVF